MINIGKIKDCEAAKGQIYLIKEKYGTDATIDAIILMLIETRGAMSLRQYMEIKKI